MNADKGTGQDHLMMTKALGAGTSNLERLAAWKEDILLDSLRYLMNSEWC